MAKHSVNVIIKARDEASKKFGRIGKTVVGMSKMFKQASMGGVAFLGSTLKSVANFTKTVLAKAFQTAKRAVLALGAAFGYAVYAFGKFETAMRKATAVSDVTGEQFDKMSKMARAAAIRLNVSAADAAKAFYFLGSAGLSATDQIKAFPAVATMAKAATIEMGQAAEILVDTMKGFKMPFTETGRVTDILSKAVTSSNMTFDQLGETLSIISGIAAKTNNSLEETTALIATMADVGIKGSRAGTSIRRSMLNLAAPVSTIRSEMQKYGIAIYDATGRMKPFIQIVGEISEKLKGTSEEQKNMAFSTLFGARAVVGQLAVFDKGRKALELYTKSLVNSGGTSQKIADKQLNSLSEQFGRLRKKITDVAIELGKAFSPALRELIRSMGDDVKRAGEFIKEHKADIIAWANKAVSAIILVKDMFGSYLDFMKKDWRAGMSFVFDSFLELLKATFESAVILAIAGGKGIWKGVKEGILGGRDRKIMAETWKRYKKSGGEFVREEKRGPLINVTPVYREVPSDRKKYLEIQKEVESEILRQQTKSILGESLGAATVVWKSAFDKIEKDAPAVLMEYWKKDTQEFRDRLATLLKPEVPSTPPRKPQGVPEGGEEGGEEGGGEGGGTAFGNLVSALRQQLQAREARLLTAAPGARYDYAQQTARNTKQQLNKQAESVKVEKKMLIALEKLNLMRMGTNLMMANFS